MGNQSSSLHQAAAHNDVEKLEWLVAHENANVNDRDKVSRKLFVGSRMPRGFYYMLIFQL